MTDVLTEAVEELKGTWESHFKPLAQQLEAEKKARGDETAETKQAIERVNDALDAIEARIEKARLDGKDRPEVDLDVRAYYETHGVKGITSVEQVEEYRSAFWGAYARKGMAPEVKDLTIANDTQAGYLVPDTFLAEILRGITEFSPIRDYIRMIQIGGGSLQVPKRTGVPTATWRGEVQAMTETNLQVGLEEISAHELTAMVDVSNQLLEDAMVDLEGYVQTEVEEQFGVAEGTAFVTGNGVNKPEGLLEGGIATTSTATNDVFVADDLINLFYALKTGYARRGTWLMNRLIIREVRKFKDIANGNYLWQPGLTAGEPPAILGRPYVETPDLASAVADAAKIAVFGDLMRAYIGVDRLQMQMQRDPYTQGDNGITRFRFRRRIGGQVVVPEAARILVVT